MGDGYVIVWPDDDMNVQVWPQDAEQIAVEYDPDREGVLRRAAKLWQIEDGRYRLNIYYPDRIRKLVTKTKKLCASRKLRNVSGVGATRFANCG